MNGLWQRVKTIQSRTGSAANLGNAFSSAACEMAPPCSVWFLISAAAYARVAAKTHPIYAELAQQTLKPVYNIALSDWFHPPVIHEVSRQAGRIRVNATNNVRVAKVRITILDAQGQTLEPDEAAQTNDPWWELETRAPAEAKIIVEAFDLAGNCTRYEA